VLDVGAAADPPLAAGDVAAGAGDVVAGAGDVVAGAGDVVAGAAGEVTAGAGGEMALSGRTYTGCIGAWPTGALRAGGNSSRLLKYPGIWNSAAGKRPIGRQPLTVIVTVVSSAVVLSAQSQA
jgi:hypothetical protein